jgi:hypothetical protein
LNVRLRSTETIASVRVYVCQQGRADSSFFSVSILHRTIVQILIYPYSITKWCAMLTIDFPMIDGQWLHQNVVKEKNDVIKTLEYCRKEENQFEKICICFTNSSLINMVIYHHFILIQTSEYIRSKHLDNK